MKKEAFTPTNNMLMDSKEISVCMIDIMGFYVSIVVFNSRTFTPYGTFLTLT